MIRLSFQELGHIKKKFLNRGFRGETDMINGILRILIGVSNMVLCIKCRCVYFLKIKSKNSQREFIVSIEDISQQGRYKEHETYCGGDVVACLFTSGTARNCQG